MKKMTVAFVGCGAMHRAEPENCVYECAVFDLSIISGYNATRIFEYIGPIISQNVETDAICASANNYVMRLFEVADSIAEIKTICSCGAKATVNARFDELGRIVTEGDQVMLGGNDRYIAVCHKCWKNKIKEQNNK